MTLPVFILVAVVLPIAVVTAIWAFAKLMSWTALRPRTLGVIQIAVGLLNFVVVALGGTEGSLLRAILAVVVGLWFIGFGVYNWFRGRPVALD